MRALVLACTHTLSAQSFVGDALDRQSTANHDGALLAELVCQLVATLVGLAGVPRSLLALCVDALARACDVRPPRRCATCAHASSLAQAMSERAVVESAARGRRLSRTGLLSLTRAQRSGARSSSRHHHAPRRRRPRVRQSNTHATVVLSIARLRPDVRVVEDESAASDANNNANNNANDDDDETSQKPHKKKKKSTAGSKAARARGGATSVSVPDALLALNLLRAAARR